LNYEIILSVQCVVAAVCLQQEFYKNKFPNDGNNWYRVVSLCGTQIQVITNWLLGAIWKFSKVTGVPWIDMGHKEPIN